MTTAKELADRIIELQDFEHDAFHCEMDKLASQYPPALVEAAVYLALETMRKNRSASRKRGDGF
jgi:hypothetical protein